MGDPQEAARFLLLEEEKLEKRNRRMSSFSLGRAFIIALIFVWLAWLTLDTKGKFLYSTFLMALCESYIPGVSLPQILPHQTHTLFKV